MADKFISIRNLKFLLFEVFDVLSLSEYPYFSRHDQKMYCQVLDAALKLSTRLQHPIFEDMDRNPPELICGQVKVHPAVAGILKEFGQGGWISAAFRNRHGRLAVAASIRVGSKSPGGGPFRGRIRFLSGEIFYGPVFLCL